MIKLKQLFAVPIVQILLFSFIILSWPFIHFPFTDGDIWNWTPVAAEMRVTNAFLSGPNDQSHGPLIAWSAAITSKWAPNSFYAYALPTILLTLLGIWYIYFLSRKLWQKENIALLNALLFSTSIAIVYLGRTPMYDWPAAIFYFGFCTFYLLHVKDHKNAEPNTWYLPIALLNIALGSLYRFSICIGLAGIFMILVNLIYKRSFWQTVKDGLLIWLSAIAINLPWLIAQTTQHGPEFFKAFLYDNFGRYIKSTKVNAVPQRDYYGFSIYTLIGVLPYTFCLVASLFRKSYLQLLKTDPIIKSLFVSFFPCLLIFSFSGHTKLARYIAFVFPGILATLGYLMATTDLKDPNYRKKCGKWIAITGIVLALLLSGLAIQFQKEVQEGMILAISIIGLIFGLLGLTYFNITKKYETLLTAPQKLLLPYTLIYMMFFTALTYETFHAPFLVKVKNHIQKNITFP